MDLKDERGQFYFSHAVQNYTGEISYSAEYRFQESEYNSIKKVVEENDLDKVNGFLSRKKYQVPFITYLTCESRLKMEQQVLITSFNEPPADFINLLYRNRKLLDKINESIFEQFQFKLVILDHDGKKLHLGLSQEDAPSRRGEGNQQSEYMQIENWKRRHFISVLDVGHGVRSVLKIVLSLYERINQIIIIDEPELFIYPSQKRWLGRKIVELTRDEKKQIFLITHDPMILQGILDVSGKSKIFRININDKGGRILCECNLSHQDDVGARRNQDSYLQGLFYKRSIVVEGASDRAFYQTMLEELHYKRIASKDLGFIACGGKGGSVNVANLLLKVEFPCAFIFDYDVLLDSLHILKTITQIRSGKTEKLMQLDHHFHNKFGTCPKDIIKGTGNTNKIGLNSAYVKANQTLFEEAIDELEKSGIFIIPGGSLESWARHVTPKTRFAEFAPDAILNDQKTCNSLKRFLNRVLDYIGC